VGGSGTLPDIPYKKKTVRHTYIYAYRDTYKRTQNRERAREGERGREREGEGERGREREREGERGRGRDRQGQTDRQTDRGRERARARTREKERARERKVRERERERRTVTKAKYTPAALACHSQHVIFFYFNVSALRMYVCMHKP
jgi:hypothetical protein